MCAWVLRSFNMKIEACKHAPALPTRGRFHMLLSKNVATLLLKLKQIVDRTIQEIER